MNAGTWRRSGAKGGRVPPRPPEAGSLTQAYNHTVKRVAALLLLLWTLPLPRTASQTIEVPYRGLRYSMLSRNGVTVMIAPLERTILEYSTAQVWVSNGSKRVVRISPQSFSMRAEAPGREEPRTFPGSPEGTVLAEIMQRARSRDMLALVHAYETKLFGFADPRSYSYYQRRKQEALAGVGAGRMRAAATASAIILADKTLNPGEFVDGTVFFRTDEKKLRITSLGARIAGAEFEFPQPAGGSRDSR